MKIELHEAAWPTGEIRKEVRLIHERESDVEWGTVLTALSKRGMSVATSKESTSIYAWEAARAQKRPAVD